MEYLFSVFYDLCAKYSSMQHSKMFPVLNCCCFSCGFYDAGNEDSASYD